LRRGPLFNDRDRDALDALEVRDDMTLTRRRNGGAVFAAGSISWTGLLSRRDNGNPVHG
jgi:hypothetical protein